MGMTLPVAESVFFWANWALVLALALGVVATYLIVVSGNTKEAFAKIEAHEAEVRDKEASERIAQLGKDAAQLSADAEASKAEIAKANARAAEAQLALERFKAPRRIEVYNIPEIDQAVAPFAGTKIDIMVLAEGPEASALGTQIGNILFAPAAGWTGRVFSWTGGGSATGVLVAPKPGSNAEVMRSASALVGALNNTGISASVFEWPGSWEQFGGFTAGATAPDAAMRIVIGAKP